MKTNLTKNINDKKFFEIVDSLGSICKSKFMREPLSESDILDLQEKFLNNGVHCITVEDANSGRELVSRFISSLNCYHENAVLSIFPEASSLGFIQEITFTDIYYDLMRDGYTDEKRRLSFDDFFIEQFYYDFLFIEASQELIDSSWFLQFFSSLKQNDIDQHMPILVISYMRG